MIRAQKMFRVLDDYAMVRFLESCELPEGFSRKVDSHGGSIHRGELTLIEWSYDHSYFEESFIELFSRCELPAGHSRVKHCGVLEIYYRNKRIARICKQDGEEE
jgi:hypothetical protein